MSSAPAHYILLLLLSALVSACDIEPVSSGRWRIEIAQEAGVRVETWTIGGDGQLRIEQNGASLTLAVQQSGSRVSGTLEGVGGAAPANFSATVNGDTLAGTLFTQQGNLTFRGQRLSD